MNIVILDGFTTNSGDLDWGPLEALGSLTVYDRTAPEEVVARAHLADALLLNKTVLDGLALSQLPRLRYIGVLATGYNTIDIEAARTRGIPVCNAAGYGTEAVAQHVFALLLALTNQVDRHARDVAAGGWSRSPDWTYRLSPLVELAGLTLGVVGLGRIGQAVARIGQALGMEVLGHNRSPREVPGVTLVPLDRLFAQSDVVSLHCPLTSSNAGFVDAPLLRQMKPTAYLINTARGPLIDEQALRATLDAGHLAGVALDVLATEPPAADHPLLQAPRCLVTPHVAWGTTAARRRLIEIAAANLRAFQAGQPRHVVWDA